MFSIFITVLHSKGSCLENQITIVNFMLAIKSFDFKEIIFGLSSRL